MRGEGCGVVVLKRLGDAVADGDRILAVIRGTAVNQDGRSGGLTAPNGPAQEKLIRRALAAAGIEPAQVSYVEAHGTGTSLGDPIEMRALGAALGAGRPTDQPLVVGSVKTNIGHLESAAGVAGLIKVVLALQHGEIPPHLHFRNPSPHIPWAELPVTVPTELTPWPAAYDRRIAGVSSFGFSGTNAHVIVEEAPEPAPAPAEGERPYHLLALSARTDDALASVAQRMAEYLAAEPAASLADVAFSANTGRSHFGHRLAVVAESVAQARERLEAVAAGGQEVAGVARGQLHGSERPEVAFLFTGQGSQYAGMGRQLYETQPTFRRAIDRCDELLRPLLPRPLRSVLYPKAGEATPIDETQYAQPALFAVEYALSELWKSWGIEPAAVLGHSVGEYVAACVAGVFSWEDALRLVAARGRLMQSLPSGGQMSAVSADESRVRAALAAHGPGVAVAALNGPDDTVISGPGASVQAVCAALAADGVRCEPLAVSHAFHSSLMDPVLDAFEREAGKVAFAPPRLTLVSDLSGRIAGDEVRSAGYWRRHLREPVRFAGGMATLHDLGVRVFVEVGPRPALLALGRRCLPAASAAWLPSLRKGRDDGSQILESLSSLHVRGADVDWDGFDRDYSRRKVALPTYPFQRERFWVEHLKPRLAEKAPARAGLRELVYEVKWRERARGAARVRHEGVGRWLVLADQGGVGTDLIRRLEERGESCELLYAGSAPAGTRGRGVESGEVEAVVGDLLKRDGAPWRGVVHLWGVGEVVVDPPTPASPGAAAWSVVSVVRAMVASAPKGTRLWVVTQGTQAVGGDVASVAGAPSWGLGKVIALEHPSLWGGLIDLGSDARDAAGLCEEVWEADGENQVALRHGARHVARLERSAIGPGEEVRLSGEGSYLVTGGLGGLGLRVAQWMVARGARHLVLTGRRGPSEKALSAIRALEESGAEVRVIPADVSQAEDVARLFGEIDAGSPPLRGVIHAAGVLDDGVLLELSRERFERVLAPKSAGAWNLHVQTRARELEFFVLFSSSASLLGSAGQGSYAAANAFLDTLAHYRRGLGLPAVSVNWGAWSEVGMAAVMAARSHRQLEQQGLGFITPEQGLAALGRLLHHRAPQVGVLVIDWERALERNPDSVGAPLLAEITSTFTAKPRPKDDAPAEERAALRLRLAEADPVRRREHLVDYLRRHLARVLGLSTPDLVETDRPLSELGLDSLMATHLKNQLEADLEADVPVAAFLTGPSVAELAALIDEARGARAPREVVLLRHAPRGAELPLSFAQEGLWFLDQMGAGSAYNLSWAMRLTGPLDASALETSLGEIERRHEALRTIFLEVEGRPAQVVLPASPRVLTRVDLRATTEADRARVARQWAGEEADRPFDLTRGPLLRTSLLRLGEDDHALVFTVHHIVADGWSIEVLVSELAVLYEAFLGGAPSPLPELPIQYSDYARWQREWLQGEVLEEQLSYWRRRLGDGAPMLELPTDHPRPAVQTHRGASQSIAFPRALADGVRALCQREGVTLFMTVLAALQALFHRYTGQDDMVIGFANAGRNRAEIEGLIGFFINNLVMRTDVSGDPRVGELLARVKGVALEAYDHQDLPFDKLVEELHPDRDHARNPIFQVALDVQNAARKELRLSGLALTPIETEVKVARFDLEIHVWESAEQLAAVFDYNTDLFEAATIERMLGHFQAILEGIVARPDARLSELPYVTPAERRQTLVDWNRTGRDYPREAGIHELFEEQVARSPEAVAVSYGEEELSYGELNARGNRLAHHLRRHGVGLEVPVGICMERSVEMVVGLLGILKAGGAYVPLDPSYPKERLAFMLEDSRVPVLLTQERMLEALPEHGARVLCLDRDWGNVAAESDANPASGAGGQSLAYVIYTSGSTGIPKGAAVPHCAVNRLVVNTDYVQVQPSDRVAQASNASFDAATFEIWGALLCGARLVGISREVTLSPRDLAAQLRRSEVTILFLTTALFNQVAREEGERSRASGTFCSGVRR